MVKYTIFGAGPSGIYSAWRLATSDEINPDDEITLIEWGDYNYPGHKGTREPAGRICTHYYKSNEENSYIEMGGMRYVEWSEGKGGHILVTKLMEKFDLESEPFETTENPLFYLRGQHMYQEDINENNPAPYNAGKFSIDPDDEFRFHPPVKVGEMVGEKLTGDQKISETRTRCNFFTDGRLPENTRACVYSEGDIVSNVGYWNFFYSLVGNEAYNYYADGNGYASNALNTNAATQNVFNQEFTPGQKFRTPVHGYSTLFKKMFEEVDKISLQKKIKFEYIPKTRLHSIWTQGDVPHFFTASAENPTKSTELVPQTSDYVFLAMPRRSLELVAQATRYQDFSKEEIIGGPPKHDFMNHPNVKNYLEAAVIKPAYKAAMFFDTAWWESTDVPYPPKGVKYQKQIYGPTITDLPLRQVYYFGTNAPACTTGKCEKVFGILASYDDMRFEQFWQELDLDVNERRKTAKSDNLQPLIGALPAPKQLENMLLLELSRLHFGPNYGIGVNTNNTTDNNPDNNNNDNNTDNNNNDNNNNNINTCTLKGVRCSQIPDPLETVVMDWGLNPFGGGYHGWAAHYNVPDVQQKIRAPAVLAGASSKPNIFIVGSAYSNVQGWVEGAFATAESVMVDFLKFAPLDEDVHDFLFVCPCGGDVSKGEVVNGTTNGMHTASEE